MCNLPGVSSVRHRCIQKEVGRQLELGGASEVMPLCADDDDETAILMEELQYK